jgi:hypothetical protein
VFLAASIPLGRALSGIASDTGAHPSTHTHVHTDTRAPRVSPGAQSYTFQPMNRGRHYRKGYAKVLRCLGFLAPFFLRRQEGRLRLGIEGRFVGDFVLLTFANRLLFEFILASLRRPGPPATSYERSNYSLGFTHEWHCNLREKSFYCNGQLLDNGSDRR